MIAQLQSPSFADFGLWIACALIALDVWLRWQTYNLGKQKQRVDFDQPVAVQIVEKLNEQFASRKQFEELVKSNTERHGQIFARIDRVEREARECMDFRFSELNKERAETMQKLWGELTMIRENIAAINRELQLRNQT